jgi:hypothetical protein
LEPRVDAPPKTTAIGAAQADEAVQDTGEKIESAIENGIRIANRLVRPATKVPLSSKVAALKRKQLWEGTVLKVHASGFIARITDRTNPKNPDEQAEFETAEISAEDHALVHPGASFYWTIGSERTPAGQIRNVAVINFRRLPRYTSFSLKRAEAKVQRLGKLLDIE